MVAGELNIGTFNDVVHCSFAFTYECSCFLLFGGRLKLGKVPLSMFAQFGERERGVGYR